MYSLCTVYTTTYPKGKQQKDTKRLRFSADDCVENQVVNIYPQMQYQCFEGFGGAFTDSAGAVYASMSPAQQKKLLQAYYGKDGLGYTLGRVHLDSCDFSVEQYQALSDPKDYKMQSFTLSQSEKHILPMIRAAQRIYGKEIPLLAAPWSPPDFMKDNQKRVDGGMLMERYRQFYAAYLCRYILEMRKAGAYITGLTVQNEPNALQPWDSCRYTALQEKEFIRDYLYPQLQKSGLGDMEIYLWDHNKERVFERVCEVVDAETERMISGAAFHWYSGDHFEALDLVCQKFPHFKLVQSEAGIAYSRFHAADFLKNAQKYAHDIIGDLNHGMTAFYDWNLLLDAQGGPNYVGNYCDAPFLYHADRGRLEERATFSYLAHFSRWIKPGARRLASTTYCAAAEVTAFQNSDSSIIAILLNQTKDVLPVWLRVAGQATRFDLPPQAIASVEMH